MNESKPRCEAAPLMKGLDWVNDNMWDKRLSELQDEVASLHRQLQEAIRQRNEAQRELELIPKSIRDEAARLDRIEAAQTKFFDDPTTARHYKD